MKAAQKAVQAQIDDINGKIDKIEKRLAELEKHLAELEKNFAKRIQSLTFVPQYSDGKIKLDYGTRTTEAAFRISPAALATLVKAENVKAFARYTDDPTTRSVSISDELLMTVSDLKSDSNGIIEVVLKDLFAESFWNGDQEAVVYIRITDDNGNDVVSEAIPMIAHNYVGNGNSIDGFVDEEDEQHTGTVAR